MDNSNTNNDKNPRVSRRPGVALKLLAHRLSAGMSISRRHFGVLSFLLLLGVSASLGTHVVVKGWETERTIADFDRRVDGVATRFSRSMDADVAILRSIVGLQSVEAGVGRRSFEAMVSAAWDEQTGIQALGWAPRVERNELYRHVRQAARDGLVDYTVFERSAETGDNIPVTERAEYFPIAYVEPRDANVPVLGLDLSVEPSLRVALSQAIATGRPAASRRVSVPTSEGDVMAVVVLVPMVATTQATLNEFTAEVSPARRDIKGFAVGAFRIDEVLADALSGVEDVMQVAVTDVTYGTLPENRRLVGGDLSVSKLDPSYSFVTGATTTFAGRTWQLSAKPTSTYLSSRRTWQAEGLLVAGLQFVALFVAYLRLIFSRSAEVERMVEQRTAELSRATHRLKREMINRRTTERALRHNEERIKGLLDMSSTSRIDLARPGGTDAFSIARQVWANQGPTVSGESTGEAVEGGTDGEEVLAVVRAEDGVSPADSKTKEGLVEQMSTDMRSPIASMIYASKILAKHKGLTPEKVSRFADIVVHEGQRLSALINEALDLSNLEAAREQSLSLEPVNCERLFSRVTSVVEAYAGRKLVTLAVLADDEVQPVVADEDRIVQVLVDLTENAIKFTPPRSTVKLSVGRHNGHYLRFSVTDSGLGLSIAEQENVFSAFAGDVEQMRDRRDDASVGLAVCKEIVERHGGTIWVDSKRGVGSTFSFTLPVVSKGLSTGTAPA